MIHPHYELAVKPLQSYFEKRFHRAHGKGFVSIAFLSLLSVLYILTPKNCVQIFNGKVHCVRRLHSLLNLSRRLSPEQIGSTCKHSLYLDILLLYRGEKTYPTVGSRWWKSSTKYKDIFITCWVSVICLYIGMSKQCHSRCWGRRKKIPLVAQIHVMLQEKELN